MRAPAVLVTVEASQQNIFISIHLAKPQCLLCVITDYKMAEDQLFCLRALVLKGKEYESQTRVRLIAICLAAACPVANVSTHTNPSLVTSFSYRTLFLYHKITKQFMGTLKYIFMGTPQIYLYSLNCKPQAKRQ